MKYWSTCMFNDKYWVGVHILSLMTGKKVGEHVSENNKLLHKILVPFLNPRQTMQYKQMWDNVYPCFTILFKFVISKRLKMSQIILKALFCEYLIYLKLANHGNLK